jgi:hypothetical protein
MMSSINLCYSKPYSVNALLNKTKPFKIHGSLLIPLINPPTQDTMLRIFSREHELALLVQGDWEGETPQSGFSSKPLNFLKSVRLRFLLAKDFNAMLPQPV